MTELTTDIILFGLIIISLLSIFIASHFICLFFLILHGTKSRYLLMMAHQVEFIVYHINKINQIILNFIDTSKLKLKTPHFCARKLNISRAIYRGTLL